MGGSSGTQSLGKEGHQAGQQEDGEQHGHVRAQVKAQCLEAGQVQEHRGAQPPDVDRIEVDVAPGVQAPQLSPSDNPMPLHTTSMHRSPAISAHGRFRRCTVQALARGGT